MTTLGTVTLSVPSEYTRNGYDVTITTLQGTEGLFTALRELFAKADYGTAVHALPGRRPLGEDKTPDNVLTVYCTFTDGTSGKPQNGWYLLRAFNYTDNESPEGHSYVMYISLFFLGTDAYYQACYALSDLETLDSDWSI